jgi:hypothetical protein
MNSNLNADVQVSNLKINSQVQTRLLLKISNDLQSIFSFRKLQTKNK